MAITYTEIKEQKTGRIWIFYIVVIAFYFIVSVSIAGVLKVFIGSGSFDINSPGFSPRLSFLSVRELLYVLLFALAVAAAHIMYSISNARSFVERSLNAQFIDPSDLYHSRFLSIVDELNVATGNKYKITPVVIPTLAMNAFAICGNNKEATLGVTEGLLSRLTRQQLQAVAAHEVGHIVSGDSLQTTIACSLFGIYAAMLTGMRKMFGKGRSTRGNGAALILLVFIILSVTQFFYNIIRLFISRDREFRADAIAVQLSRDPSSLSEALYAISRGWRGLGYIEPSLESLFIMNPVKEDVDEENGFLPDLFSTHPPVSKRMAILAAMAHEKVDDIKADVLAQEKAIEGAREAPKDTDLRWLAKDETGAWKGPFGVLQMALLGWIRPDTLVRPVGGESSKPAKDEPFLIPMFDRKAADIEMSGMNCPKCAHPLVVENYEGFRVHHCVFCEGYLVDENKMPRAIIRKEKGFAVRIEKLAELTQKDGRAKLGLRAEQRAATSSKCPKCGGPLVKVFYTMAYLVEVEKCFSCNMIWFDKDELAVVQYLIENKRAA